MGIVEILLLLTNFVQLIIIVLLVNNSAVIKDHWQTRGDYDGY